MIPIFPSPTTKKFFPLTFLKISKIIAYAVSAEKSFHLIDLILDKAGNKGTGSWSSKASFDFGMPTTMMSSAVFARFISSFKAKRVIWDKKRSKTVEIGIKVDLDAVRNAYQFARIINHHQGFELIRKTSNTYDWNLDLAEIARIWTNGCIIKSDLMNDIKTILDKNKFILDDDDIFSQMVLKEDSIGHILMNAFQHNKLLMVT